MALRIACQDNTSSAGSVTVRHPALHRDSCRPAQPVRACSCACPVTPVLGSRKPGGSMAGHPAGQQAGQQAGTKQGARRGTWRETLRETRRETFTRARRGTLRKPETWRGAWREPEVAWLGARAAARACGRKPGGDPAPPFLCAQSTSYRDDRAQQVLFFWFCFCFLFWFCFLLFCQAMGLLCNLRSKE